MPSERIMMPAGNGAILEIYDNGTRISDEKLKMNTVLIDGKGKGHLSGEYVIKARQIMAEWGMVLLTFKVDTESGELVGNVQIESRWFVYSSEVKNIHTQVVDFARKNYISNKAKWRSIHDNLKDIKEDLSGFLSKIIGREPLVITTFVYINRDALKSNEDISDEEALLGNTLEEQGGIHEES